MENENKDVILSVQNLKISFKTDEGMVHAVRGVSFDLHKGETLCIVGESGSGKSVTSKTIMGILPGSAVIEDGKVMFEGEDLTKIEENEFHRIRGHKIGMIFQDPLSSLNPIMKIGKQITESMLVNSNRMKVRFNNLISQDEANHKNAKVRRDSKIRGVKHAVEASDADYQSQIDALDVKKTQLQDEIAYMKANQDPKVEDKKNEYETFMSTYKQTKEDLKAKKKSEHDRLKALIKPTIEEANKKYKEEIPQLKVKLADAKKAAKANNAAWKKDVIASHKDALVDLENEKKETALKFDEEIKQLKKQQAEAPSQVLEQPKVDAKVKEKEEALKAIDLRIEEENDNYKNAFHLSRKAAKKKAIQVLREVGIPQPEVRFNKYPFEFSGGMRQRIVIAIALTANPDILICDEPTTALDVTIQAQILELINRLKAERNMSIIFISHDLGVVANMADRVAVMYAGKIVEVGTANDIFYDPRHPYTWALLSSIPDIDSKEKLEAIPGTPPYLLNPPKGDAFAARNKYAMAIDFKAEPPYFKVSETHYASTWLLDKRAPKVEKPKIVSQRIKANLKKAGIENVTELTGK